MTWITRDEAAERLQCHTNGVARAVRSAPFAIRSRDPGRGKDGRRIQREYWGPDIDRLVELRKSRPRTNIGRKACAKKIHAQLPVNRLWPHGGTGRGLMGEP